MLWLNSPTNLCPTLHRPPPYSSAIRWGLSGPFAYRGYRSPASLGKAALWASRKTFVQLPSFKLPIPDWPGTIHTALLQPFRLPAKALKLVVQVAARYSQRPGMRRSPGRRRSSVVPRGNTVMVERDRCIFGARQAGDQWDPWRTSGVFDGAWGKLIDRPRRWRVLGDAWAGIDGSFGAWKFGDVVVGLMNPDDAESIARDADGWNQVGGTAIFQAPFGDIERGERWGCPRGNLCWSVGEGTSGCGRLGSLG